MHRTQGHWYFPVKLLQQLFPDAAAFPHACDMDVFLNGRLVAQQQRVAIFSMGTNPSWRRASVKGLHEVPEVADGLARGMRELLLLYISRGEGGRLAAHLGKAGDGADSTAAAAAEDSGGWSGGRAPRFEPLAPMPNASTDGDGIGIGQRNRPLAAWQQQQQQQQQQQPPEAAASPVATQQAVAPGGPFSQEQMVLLLGILRQRIAEEQAAGQAFAVAGKMRGSSSDSPPAAPSVRQQDQQPQQPQQPQQRRKHHATAATTPTAPAGAPRGSRAQQLQLPAGTLQGAAQPSAEARAVGGGDRGAPHQLSPPATASAGNPLQQQQEPAAAAAAAPPTSAAAGEEALWGRYEAAQASIAAADAALAQARAGGEAGEVARLAAREAALREEAALLLRLLLAKQQQQQR
jgi:hypothetical protein